MFFCFDCKSDLDPDGLLDDFKAVGQKILCPNCGSLYEVWYESTVDDHYFTLVRVIPDRENDR